MTRHILVMTAFLAWHAGLGFAAAAGEAADAGQQEVLGNDSTLRRYLVFRTPVLITPDGQVKTAPAG